MSAASRQKWTRLFPATHRCRKLTPLHRRRTSGSHRVCDSARFMLALSDLRWHHAHGRTDIPCRTPAPCSTADSQVCTMTGLLRTRSADILRDEPQTSASCPDQASIHKAGNADGCLSETRSLKPHTARARTEVTDNGMSSQNRQPCLIQNT